MTPASRVAFQSLPPEAVTPTIPVTVQPLGIATFAEPRPWFVRFVIV